LELSTTARSRRLNQNRSGVNRARYMTLTEDHHHRKPQQMGRASLKGCWRHVGD
jgi:hypothetical protein